MVRLSGPILAIMVLGASLFLSVQPWGQGAAAQNGDSLVDEQDCIYIFNYDFLGDPPSSPRLPLRDPPDPRNGGANGDSSLESFPDGALVELGSGPFYGVTGNHLDDLEIFPTDPKTVITLGKDFTLLDVREISQHEQGIRTGDCLFLGFQDPIKLFPGGGVADLRANPRVTDHCVRLINSSNPPFESSIGAPGGITLLAQLLDPEHCSNLGPLPELNPNVDRRLGDLNCDGIIDLRDIRAALETMVNRVLAPCVGEGDANGNGLFDGADALSIADHVLALREGRPLRLDHVVPGSPIGDVVTISRELKGPGNFKGAGVLLPINGEMPVMIDLNSRVVHGHFIAQGSTNSDAQCFNQNNNQFFQRILTTTVYAGIDFHEGIQFELGPDGISWVG